VAYIRKLPSKKYQGIAIHPSGRKVTKAFPLKAQAREWAKDTEAGWKAGTVRDPRAAKLTLGDWYVLWLAARTVAESTAERQGRIHVKHVLPKWGTWPLETIGRIDVQAWVVAMTKAGHSPNEVQTAFYALSGMLREAMDQTPPLVTHNACARIKLPPLPAAPTRYFTPEEMGAALGVTPEPWRTMVELSMWTRLRWGELDGLQSTPVDWERDMLYVATVRTLAGDKATPKSPESKRNVPIPPWLTQSMWALVAERTKAAKLAAGGRVFADEAGEPLKYNTWWWFWKRACRLTGMPYASPHTLRHTAASWLAQDGVSQFEIGELLGHASGKPTKRYTHLRPGAHDNIRGTWAKIGRLDVHTAVHSD
jgi:integrase